MLTTEGKDRKDFRIKKLKLYYKNELVEISTQWLCPRECLLVNCQSVCSFENCYALTKLCQINWVILVFLTKTWLYSEISNPENFLGSSFNIIARHDRDRGEDGGCLIAQCTKDPLKKLDISIPAFEFAVSCVVFSDTPSFFLLVYNPPSSSAYSIDIEELVKCLDAYFRKFHEVLRQFAYGTKFNIYRLGDFNFPSIDWNTYSSSNASESHFIDFIVDHGLSQFVNEASHRSTNILDLVLSNQNVLVSNGKHMFSDHYPIFFNLEVVNSRSQSLGAPFQNLHSTIRFLLPTYMGSLNSCQLTTLWIHIIPISGIADLLVVSTQLSSSSDQKGWTCFFSIPPTRCIWSIRKKILFAGFPEKDLSFEQPNWENF